MGAQEQAKPAHIEDYAESRETLLIRTGTVVSEGMIPSHLKVLIVAQGIPIGIQGPSSPVFLKGVLKGIKYLYARSLTEGSDYPAGLELFLVNYSEGTVLPDGVLTHIQPCDHRKMPVDRVHYMYSHGKMFEHTYLPEFEYTPEPSTTAFGWGFNIIKCTPKPTAAFVRQCLTDKPIEDFIEAHADQIDIRYQNYLPVRTLFKTCNRRRIEFFLNHVPVPPKVLTRVFWMLCSEGESRAAELALDLTAGLSTGGWDTECYVNLGRVAAAGSSFLVKKLLAMPGGNEYEKVAYALRGAISGSHTGIIADMLDRYTKIDCTAMTPEAIKLYRRCARSIVYYASKISDKTQFFIVLSSINKVCHWGKTSNSVGFYYALDLTSYRKNRLKTNIVSKILNSCMRHKTKSIAKIFVDRLLDPLESYAPESISPACLFAACKSGDADTIQLIFDCIASTSYSTRTYDVKTYEEALLVCSTKEAITKLIDAGRVTISASNIATIKAASPLVRECVSSYLEQLAREIRSA